LVGVALRTADAVHPDSIADWLEDPKELKYADVRLKSFTL